MAARIYHVIDNNTGKERLVNAGLPAQVLRHVAKDAFTIKPVAQADLVRLLTQASPVAVEQAGAESASEDSGEAAQEGELSPEGVAQEGDETAQGEAENPAEPVSTKSRRSRG